MIVRNFLKDDSAVVGLPLRILIAIILFSAILGLSVNAVNRFIADTEEKTLMGELDIIEKHAAAMYINGGARDITNPDDTTGTIDHITVRIPDNVAFVVFGAMPDASRAPPSTRPPHADNVYYYVLTDGRVHARSSVARFSANDTGLDRPAVLYPGEYDLTMELVRNNNGTYVTIEQKQ